MQQPNSIMFPEKSFEENLMHKLKRTQDETVIFICLNFQMAELFYNNYNNNVQPVCEQICQLVYTFVELLNLPGKKPSEIYFTDFDVSARPKQLVSLLANWLAWWSDPFLPKFNFFSKQKVLLEFLEPEEYCT
ncbi:hypothetical protein T10_11215 [Trichinella papuae]|uniref:Uncharacterized protein n=1 Tax=Trichinella papuae TaxID=268474 RepID=A0A0V1N241_9BILA|nr:hypothetical protein T10_11215 [Trichinella papuae]